MSNLKSPMIGLIVLQVIAIILYPPAFFAQAPQAAVLPPALLILMAIALFTTNTGGLSLEAGRNSLVFVQGINIVVRVMTFFPNLKSPDENWNWFLLIAQIMGMGLSWYTMIQLEKQPLKALLLKSKPEG
jgi:hypothetical protein